MTLSRAPEYVVLLGFAAAGAVYALGSALIVLRAWPGGVVSRLAALSCY